MMDVLMIGAGVVGTVYGAHLAAAGEHVAVLAHGARTAEVAAKGLIARDVEAGTVITAAVRVVARPDTQAYDLVVIAVTGEQLATASSSLPALVGTPTILVLGNIVGGRAGLPLAIRDRVQLGFPGIGGTLVNGVAEYVLIEPQPTALESPSDAHVEELAAVLIGRGFAVQRVADMDGWLAYHSVLVACICAALYRCGSDTLRLSQNRATLRLMCLAVSQGFAALRRRHVAGQPRNLHILHTRLLAPIAVVFWTRTMRSPTGELWFGAHARHARGEMQALAADVVDRLGGDPRVDGLCELLGRGSAPSTIALP